MSQRLPSWAVVPKHKKTVVASSKGWIVEDTGEILVRVRDLDQKLSELGILTDFIQEPAIGEGSINDLDVITLPTSPVFVDGKVIPVIKVEDTIVEVVKEELIDDTPLNSDPVVITVDELAPTEPALVVVEDKVLEDEVVAVVEKAPEAVVVGDIVVVAKKKAGRPKKVKVEE